jgi:hypothetical protein
VISVELFNSAGVEGSGDFVSSATAGVCAEHAAEQMMLKAISETKKRRGKINIGHFGSRTRETTGGSCNQSNLRIFSCQSKSTLCFCIAVKNWCKIRCLSGELS